MKCGNLLEHQKETNTCARVDGVMGLCTNFVKMPYLTPDPSQQRSANRGQLEQIGDNWKKGKLIATRMWHSNFVAMEGEQHPQHLKREHLSPWRCRNGGRSLTTLCRVNQQHRSLARPSFGLHELSSSFGWQVAPAAFASPELSEPGTMDGNTSTRTRPSLSCFKVTDINSCAGSANPIDSTFKMYSETNQDLQDMHALSRAARWGGTWGREPGLSSRGMSFFLPSFLSLLATFK